MTGWGQLQDLVQRMEDAGWPAQAAYVQLWLPGTGEHIHGQVVELETGKQAGDFSPRARITVKDSRGNLHVVDWELVGSFHVYGAGRAFMDAELLEMPPLGENPIPVTFGPHAERRVQRALAATRDRYCRPYVHLAADRGWVVHHPLAPVGFRYDSLQDAYRVAAGCVA